MHSVKSPTEVMHRVAVWLEFVEHCRANGHFGSMLAWAQDVHFTPWPILFVLPVLMLFTWPLLLRTVRLELGHWRLLPGVIVDLLLQVATVEASLYLVISRPESLAFWMLLTAAVCCLAISMKAGAAADQIAGIPPFVPTQRNPKGLPIADQDSTGNRESRRTVADVQSESNKPSRKGRAKPKKRR